MSAFVLLAQATNLPPPPAPRANHPVSAFSILLVIAIVLGSVAMIALSTRRFRRRPAEPPFETPQSASNAVEPVKATMETEALHPDPPETDAVDPNLMARLRRVTGVNPVERRKLGRRKSDGAPDEREVHGDPPPPAGDGFASDPGPSYPEPIPIRRRAASKWPDEPVIANGAHAGGTIGVWAGGRDATVPGLTNEELSQLETPRFVARAAPPYPRLKPEAKLPKKPAAPDPDQLLLSELSSTVRELLFCANSGDLLHGFALYSDPFLFRAIDDSGLDEDQFQKTYSDRPAKPVAEWARLAEVRDLERIAPDLVAATVIYASRAIGSAMPAERFRFVKDHDSQNWLIDDIAPVEPAT